MTDPKNDAPPAGQGPRAQVAQTTGDGLRGNGNAAAVQTSSSLRRCPWHADVIELAARPGAWHGTAILHAGTGAWDRAKPTRDAGRRACTVLPPGTDPAAVRWPSIASWIGDTGDLPTADAIALARCLIDCGADRVHLIGEHIRPSMTMRRAAR